MDEPSSTLKEVNRILKPGGVFATIDYDWPASMNYPTEYAIYTIRQFVKENRILSKHESDGYPKSKHIDNMQKSGHFEYVRELVFSIQDEYSQDRLIKMIESISSFQNTFQHKPDLMIPRFQQFIQQIHSLNIGNIPVELGYRIRLGVKKHG